MPISSKSELKLNLFPNLNCLRMGGCERLRSLLQKAIATSKGDRYFKRRTAPLAALRSRFLFSNRNRISYLSTQIY